MNTTSATRTSDQKRPLFVRMARRWYSWAGLALTMTASYLAFDGQLKLSIFNQLQAAPPPDVLWTANPTPSEPKLDLLPAPAKLPDLLAADTARPLVSPKVGEILDSYINGQELARMTHEEAPENAGPKMPAPPALPDNTLVVPVPLPDPVGVNEPVKPEIPDDKPKALPPVAPRKLSMPDHVVEKPSEEKTPTTVLGEKDLVQEGEPIPTKPTLESSTNAAVAAEVESLKPEEQLLYEAAQLNARSKDYPKAIEMFDQLLKLRPDLLYIRAEYAGIMVTAGELVRAVELYKRVLQMKPDSTLFRIRLGDVYVIGKDYKAAIKLYTEALKSPPFEPEYAVRLARAYAFDNDFPRAFQVYDRLLAPIKPEDPRAPAAMGALLLDLDLPAEAMPYLQAKRKHLEKDPRRREIMLLEVLGGLIRAHARLGERQAALELIQELPTLAVEQIGIRETLAAQLFGIDEFELSAQVYNQILQLEPTNGVAIIGMARIYLEMSQPALARQILDSFRPAPRQMRDYLSTYAVYHQRVGEYIEARQVYTDMLRRNPNDHEIRLALGKIHDYYKDEWERAKAEFAKIPPQDRFGRDARRSFADALSHQRKFTEAIEIDRQLLAEDPCDYVTIAMMIRHMSKGCLYDQAIAAGRGFLATSPRSENQANTVRKALGRALIDAGKYLDAVREFEILISRPSGRSVEAYYGLMRAHEKLGNLERAKQFLACLPGLPGGEFRNRLALAELYAIDFDDNRAIEVCMGLLNLDPRHIPTLIRLGDSQQRLSRFSGNPSDVFQTAGLILNQSSSNVRGHMMTARSFAVAQNFRKACGQYDQLILLDPEQFSPRLERARCLYADHQYSAARSSYEAIQRPSADEQLIINLNDAMANEPKLKAVLEPYVIGGLGGQGMRKELGRLEVTVPDPDLRLAIHRVVCDYDARLARHNAVRLEQEGLELKDYRQFQALAAIPRSFEFEPSNVDMMFAMGQQLGTMRYTNEEMGFYSQVLSIDPTHRDAMVASERANAEMGPKLDGSYSYFRQRGRQGLAAIDRQRYTVDGRVPLGDEDEYLMLGYQRAYYSSPFNYPHTLGNIPFIRAQYKGLDNRLLGYAQVNVEEYNNGFDTRPTFDLGVIYQSCDWVWLRAGGYLENVIENGESIRQDITRGGIYFGADLRPTRIWAFGGEFRYANYSDDNDMNAFTLYNELALTQPPKMLKVAQRLYFWGYREQTIFPTDPPQEANIFGAVHPYFAPSGFSQIELRLEWYHWLSRDYFVHSNQCWYSLQYGIMTDNTLTTYHNLRAMLNYDVCTWLTIGGQADAQLSGPYDMYSAIAYMQIRFK